jgi:hypothetical protein
MVNVGDNRDIADVLGILVHNASNKKRPAALAHCFY